MSNREKNPVVALVLAGGGARAAYQVGVLKAVAEMLPKDAKNPFPIVCGTSAGAINAAAVAIHAQRFQHGIRRLVRVWRHFRVSQVFRADAWGIFQSGMQWVGAMLFGGLGKYNPHALLDRTPLSGLLSRYLPCDKIKHSIESGALHAFSITASGYTSGQSVSFFQGAESLRSWSRARRIGVATEINVDHLLASSAIPFVFSAIKINREYYGDGSMRQTSPLSPALHLGAERIFVIGVHSEKFEAPERFASQGYPSLAEVAGYVLDSIFLDSLETDLERLRRINKTISLIPSHNLKENNVTLRPVDVLVVTPSEDLNHIASRFAHELPLPVRMLLYGVGVMNRRGSNLVSYLLFERGFCNELIELGYKDASRRKEEIMAFLGQETPKTETIEEDSIANLVAVSITD